jgi:DNA-binding NarL/FixJ family response regulator
MNLVRILIVDDFEPWRCFVQSVFRESPDFEIVGESSDGLEATRVSAELQPDLVLLDIGLPGLNGFDAARKIRHLSPNSKIVFLSLNWSQAMVWEAQELGAHAFISKLDVEYGLIHAVRTALGSN